MTADGIFGTLATRMGYADSDLLVQILTRLMTADEGRFLLELPASNAELAAKFNQDEKTVEETVHHLAHRGLIVPSPNGLTMVPDPGRLRDYVLSSAPEFIPPEVPALIKEFHFRHLTGGVWDKMKQPLMRVMAAQRSIAGVPGVLPADTVKGMIDANPGPVALVNCSCRVMMRDQCEHPVRNCLHFGSAFGASAEFDIYRGCTPISKEQAVAESLAAEEAGLVNMIGNSSASRSLVHFCHCCGCGCLALVGRIQSGTVSKLVSPSRFLAKADEETCNGCQDCVERCYFNAIEMVKPAGSKKLKAAIDADKCLGCGQCVLACSVEAVEMACVRPPEHIPAEFQIPSELLHEHHS